jgi:AAA+ ATPase superfamily predicted ATPase
MQNELIGRQTERLIMQQLLESNQAELLAVVGRRRVGKTFLIQQALGSRMVFEITGVQNGKLKDQLRNFKVEINERSNPTLPIQQPNDWHDAFLLLKSYLTPLVTGDEKPVVFFDELPWLASKKSGFLEAFGYFWNTWASRKSVVVVICGSAASWMIQNVVNNRGGLHNRITRRIFLEPFTLAETELFLQSRNLRFSRNQIVQLYMATGGIPHYLQAIRPGRSAVQSIDDLCFSKSGLLRDEFKRLYFSLFADADQHIAAIRLLGKHRQGLTRQAIVEGAKLSEGGSTTKVLGELEHSGFISAYQPFGKKKKEIMYRLTDEYSLFYLQFIENNAQEGEGLWQALSQTQAYKSWSGYAYENICLKHLPQIKKAMGIFGILAQSSSFLKKGDKNEKGAQINLVLDRNDQIINLFEIKFHNEAFALKQANVEELREKARIFKESTKTLKHLSWVMVTTHGLKENEYRHEIIDVSLSLEALFS